LKQAVPPSSYESGREERVELIWMSTTMVLLRVVRRFIHFCLEVLLFTEIQDPVAITSSKGNDVDLEDHMEVDDATGSGEFF
jgi:hypothetical protein